MVAGVRVEGVPLLRKQLKATGTDLTELRAAGKVAAEIVADDARTRTVPRRSGTLGGSIRAVVGGRWGTGEVRAGNVRIPYANVIHFGWPAHNIEPQPFLYDSLDNRGDDVRQAYESSIDEIIKKAGLA